MIAFCINQLLTPKALPIIAPGPFRHKIRGRQVCPSYWVQQVCPLEPVPSRRRSWAARKVCPVFLLSVQ